MLQGVNAPRRTWWGWRECPCVGAAVVFILRLLRAALGQVPLPALRRHRTVGALRTIPGRADKPNVLHRAMENHERLPEALRTDWERCGRC